MGKSFEEEEVIFNAALALSAESRSAFLEKCCGGDAQLHARLQRLLQAHERSLDLVVPLRAGSYETFEAGAGDWDEIAAGQQVGPYTLVKQIGEGGWGVVYLAEQHSPVRRRVAVKLIKLGMDSRAVITRFEAERQALAMMDHPNIARVFDAGTTSAGRLYFVMELVDGVRVTEYCDRERLTVPQRLRLFVLICHALQHAHQKGIIHRDIKPSNILVVGPDGSGAEAVPKIIDFGIAKATEGRLADGTALTTLDHFVGTPAYVSPEQADWRLKDVDTRSDVYSLGILLYELLAGVTPFDGQELMRLGLHEMRRVIREQEPARPSAKFAALPGEVRTAAAARRCADPSRLGQQIRGDLDWITMRAIGKQPADRYSTAHELAADVLRHLGHEPVLAGPPSSWYRIKKYARRRRAAFFGFIAVSGALIAGLAVALAGLQRARAAQRTAESALAEAEAVTEFFTTIVGAADPARSGREVTVREVLENGSRAVATQFDGRPLLQARLHEAIGETYKGLGVFDAASLHLKETVGLRSRLLGTTHPDTLRARASLGWVLVMTPEIERAVPFAVETLTAYARVPNPVKRDLANAHLALSFAQFVHAGLQEDSIHHIKEAVALLSEVLGANHSETISARVELAAREWTTERFDEGRDHCERLITETESFPDHPARGQLFHIAALIAEELGDYGASASFAERCDEVRTRSLGEQHYQTHNARILRAFAVGRIADPHEALRMANEVIRIHEKILPSESPQHPMSMTRTANLLGLVGHHEKAVAMARQAVTRLQVFFGNAPFAFRAVADLAMIECLAGSYAEAERRSRELLETLRRAPRRYEYSYSRANIALATALTGQRRFEEAEKILLENHATLVALALDVKHQRQLTRKALAALYVDWGKPADAAKWR